MSYRRHEHWSAPSCRFAGIALSAMSLLAEAAAPAPTTLTAPSPGIKTTPAPGSDGSFMLTLTLNVSLTGLSPDAVQGLWLCSARAMNKPALDAEISKITGMNGSAARAEYASFLEYRAHYLNQQTTATFPIAGGAAAGTQQIAIKVSRDDLLDPGTKRLIDQPAVLVGCWLRLADEAGQGGFAYQVASPSGTALLQVTSPPYFIASAGIPNE